MPDIVPSIFRLENDRGLFVPQFNIKYIEKDTGLHWIINCGGSRAYFIRIGDNLGKDFEDQCADSHFMVSRLVTALFLSGFGLFRAKAMGRLLFEKILSEETNFHCHLDLLNITRQEDNNDIKQLYDWFHFICQNNLFRRAAEDAYAALVNPIEAVFYIYRGMEWILKAGNIGWRELADDIGISFKDIKRFKQMANVDLGQRHGIKSGIKMRAKMPGYASLVADFLYGLCNVRKRVDRSYKGISSKRVSQIVMNAMPVFPYP